MWALLLPTVLTTLAATPARLLVLDALLPGQKLRCEAAPPAFRELCESSAEPLVVVGRNRWFVLTRGVEVGATVEGEEVVLTPTGRIAEVGVERLGDDDDRWTGRVGSVEWLGSLQGDDLILSPDDEYCRAKAIDHAGCLGNEEGVGRLERLGATLEELSSEWMELMRTERPPATEQLEKVVSELGREPPAEPNARALWVAALINARPDLGVAMEIRPAVLTARSTSRRMSMAEDGLRESIARLQKGPTDA